MTCTCKCGNEPSDSIKCGEFDQLRTGQLLKKDFTTWSKKVPSGCRYPTYIYHINGTNRWTERESRYLPDKIMIPIFVGENHAIEIVFLRNEIQCGRVFFTAECCNAPQPGTVGTVGTYLRNTNFLLKSQYTLHLYR